MPSTQYGNRTQVLAGRGNGYEGIADFIASAVEHDQIRRTRLSSNDDHGIIENDRGISDVSVADHDRVRRHVHLYTYGLTLHDIDANRLCLKIRRRQQRNDKGNAPET